MQKLRVLRRRKKEIYPYREQIKNLRRHKFQPNTMSVPIFILYVNRYNYFLIN